MTIGATRADTRIPEGALTLGLRPEHLVVCKPEEGLRGRVDLVEELGDSTVIYTALAGTKQIIAAKLQGHQRDGLKSGDAMGVRPLPDTSNLFDANGKADRRCGSRLRRALAVTSYAASRGSGARHSPGLSSSWPSKAWMSAPGVRLAEPMPRPPASLVLAPPPAPPPCAPGRRGVGRSSPLPGPGAADPIAERFTAAAAALERDRRAPEGLADLAALAALDDELPDLGRLAAVYGASPEIPTPTPRSASLARFQLAGLERSRGNLLRAAAQLKRLGFVSGWQVVGPFDDEGKRGHAIAFPPEQRRGPRRAATRARSARWPGARCPGDAEVAGFVAPRGDAPPAAGGGRLRARGGGRAARRAGPALVRRQRGRPRLGERRAGGGRSRPTTRPGSTSTAPPSRCARGRTGSW